MYGAAGNALACQEFFEWILKGPDRVPHTYPSYEPGELYGFCVDGGLIS